MPIPPLLPIKFGKLVKLTFFKHCWAKGRHYGSRQIMEGQTMSAREECNLVIIRINTIPSFFLFALLWFWFKCASCNDGRQWSFYRYWRSYWHGMVILFCRKGIQTVDIDFLDVWQGAAFFSFGFRELIQQSILCSYWLVFQKYWT